jgi:SAM-dependent methyltransferase
MVEWATKRAVRAHLEDEVEFRVADAQNLPFEDGFFDIVFDESVLGFVPDPTKAVREYARVARPGGYVGLNESSWLKPPPAELEQVLSSAFAGANLTYPDRLRSLLESAGLQEIQVQMKTTSAREDVRDRLRWFGLAGVLGNTARMLRMWASSPENRKMLRHFLGMQASVPKDLYEYYGYGLYVGRTPLPRP